jgi:medium-chain acyl-[acyl-carrier-protein] hydrolase
MSAVAGRMGGKSPNGWFCRFGDGGDVDRRVICFHHAGGGASAFRDWWRDCPRGTEILAASLPGREARLSEPPLDRMEPLAEHLVDALPVDKPFVFFGHSFGAFVAFEVARQLAGRDKPQPEHLFVSACRAPHRSLSEKTHDELDDAQLSDKIFRLGGTPREVIESPGFAEMLFPALRADLRIADRYRVPATAERTVPITAYAGTRDEGIGETEIAAWRDHSTQGRFTMRSFEGDHFYLVPHRTTLIADLLSRWQSGTQVPAANSQTGIAF